MAKQKPKRKGIVRLCKALGILAFVAILGLIGWIYLVPMLTADSILLYDSFIVEEGDIQTTLSFSASLNVKKTETFTASEMSRVKELYVTSGDEVSEGDPLVLLSNGESFSAGFDGVVNEIRAGVGDWVRPIFSVVQVCDLVNLEVSMDVDEYDVKSLSVGQNCIVRIISLGIDFETVIAHINRVSTSSGTLAYYTVSCDLSVPEEVLPGMRATVIIPDESVDDVTMVSMNALAFDDEEQAYVLLKDSDGHYKKQFVETGLSDGMNVEITDGLEVGQTVYTIAGMQSVTAGFSLEDIYISLTGEKVVVNTVRGQMMGGRNETWSLETAETMPADMGNMPDIGAIPGKQNVSGVQDHVDIQSIQNAQMTDTDEKPSDTNTETTDMKIKP